MSSALMRFRYRINDVWSCDLDLFSFGIAVFVIFAIYYMAYYTDIYISVIDITLKMII